VTAKSGKTVSYDKLLIATGSDPFIIPVPGQDLPGVVTFRDLDDVDKMLAAAGLGGNAVVIGGGLLGLEAAHGLALRGMQVTVLHLMPTLMERQLDEAAGWLLKSELERRGQTILTGADTAEIVGMKKVEAVRLKDGTRIPADIVVMAVGIRPSTRLAKEPGLAVGRGIQVDDHMVTSDPMCLRSANASSIGPVYGLVAPLWDMCRSLADGTHRHEESLYRLRHLHQAQGFGDRPVFSAGDFSGGDGCEDIVLRDATRGIYKRVIVKDDKILGAVLYGDTADGNWYFDLLKKGEDISDIRDALIFGQAFASGGGATANPIDAVAALLRRCGDLRLQRRFQGQGDGLRASRAARTHRCGARTCKASASCGSAPAWSKPAAIRCWATNSLESGRQADVQMHQLHP
jgi:nitrite reductase (NADH) large subunit